MNTKSDATPRGVRLSDEQRLAWLRLIRSENVGPATFRDLINHFGSASAALDALPELSRRGGKRTIRIAPEADAIAELRAAEANDSRFVALGEPDYPPLLRHADAPPPLIAVKGGSEILTTPMVAIVGSRNASIAGARMAETLANGLGEAGIGVVSGLARGIDIAAHKASLLAGTVAVLAGGLDKVYPPENEPFLNELFAADGAVVTEMPFGWQPRSRDFPRRNRIVAGMAYGVVVVEAARRSGALITARLAGEIGRLVFAVPGSPLDSRSEGANKLLKSGATLVTDVNDILTEIAPLLEREPPPSIDIEEREDMEPVSDADIADDVRHGIISALGPVPVEIDEIVRHTGQSVATVRLVIVELELAGRLERHPGGKVSLLP